LSGPAQFNKPIGSAQWDPGPPLRVIRTAELDRALNIYFNDPSDRVADRTRQPGPPNQ